MAMGDWAVFGCFLVVAALVGWLALRHLARQDQNPEMAKMWPEWWEEAPPDDWGHPVIEERLEGALSRIISWAATPPAHAPGLVSAASSLPL
jgi:hypothetical protein